MTRDAGSWYKPWPEANGFGSEVTEMKRNVNIHIGGIYASRGSAVISTILGSCVAVCLYDPENGVGGMNHILLPGRADLTQFNTVARFGINAMELLINRILVLGGNRRNLVAKAFGGAHTLPSISVKNGVGGKNVEFVLEFLHMENIALINHDLGGYDTRRIYFHTDTGEVFLQRIIRSGQGGISIKERRLLDRVRRESEQAGDVILFE